MSCTESSDTLERFLTLPKFTYRDRKETTTGKPGDTPPPGNAHELIQKFFASIKKDLTESQKADYIAKLNNLSKLYGGSGNVVPILNGKAGARSNWQAAKLFNVLSDALKDKEAK